MGQLKRNKGAALEMFGDLIKISLSAISLNYATRDNILISKWEKKKRVGSPFLCLILKLHPVDAEYSPYGPGGDSVRTYLTVL